MNIEFEKALKFIDLGNYDKAIQALETAIRQAEEEKDDISATEYRCVLGELYVNLEMEEQARETLTSVVEFCDERNVLSKQRIIAKAYLNAYDGIPLPEELKNRSNKKPARPGNMPLVPKPVQNKAFISKQMSKKHR